ncbi:MULTISPECIES: hypothetical protein [Flavobacterium]|uniref:Lipoprotein n=1 Tax=Flavobacterium jumunjinense TaxID=998845 RepID=A0ABV5GRQ6_9FLAO|nr:MULTISPECIES: hypothetical protein [Flavobacterium]
MKKYILLIPLLGIISCNTYKRDKFTYNQDNKQSWIDSYKYEAFYGCINEGLENDSLRILLKNKDLLNSNLDLSFSIIDEARSFGKKIIKNMPKPIIKIDKGDESLKNKNFISYNCLKYYASKDLDSIAHKAYKDKVENSK